MSYFTQWREATRKYLGGKCVKCGSISNLEFDHINPNTKSFVLSRLWSIKDKVKLQIEIDKCQLLCKVCHKIKTDKENSLRFKKNRANCHGTLSQYMRYNCRCIMCKSSYSIWRQARYERLHI